MGLQTPDGRNGAVLRTRAPGMWSGNAVRRILTTEAYAGILRYRRRTGSGGKRGKRPKKDQIPIPLPIFVFDEFWNAARERRELSAFRQRVTADADASGAVVLDFHRELVAGIVEATFEFKLNTLEDLRVHVKLANDEQARSAGRIKGTERAVTFDTSKKDN